MINSIFSFSILIFMAVSFLGYGSVVMGKERWSAKMAAGILTVGILVTISGWSGFLYPCFLWIVFAVGIIFAIFRIRKILPEKPLFLLLPLILLIPLAWLPPSSRDALNHHLYLPRMWLETSHIHQLQWCRFAAFPYLGEAIYSFLGGTFGFRFSRLFSMLSFITIGAVLVEMGRKKSISILSILILISIPEAFRNASWAYVDSLAALFSILAFRELISEKGDAVKAVIWASAAGFTKYNTLLILPLVIIGLLTCKFRPDRKQIVWCIIFILAITSLWAVPNTIIHGNPVYPLARSIFGQVNELSGRASLLIADYQSYIAPIHRVTELLFVPYLISVRGQWDDPRLFDGPSGPLLLAGVILFLLLSSKRRDLMFPIVFIVLAVLFSWPAIRTRYLLPGLVIMALYAADGFIIAAERGIVSRVIVCIALAVGLFWSAGHIVDLYILEQPFRFAGRDTEYLLNNEPHHEFFLSMSEFVEPEDTVLLVNMGNRAFYCPCIAIYDTYRFPFSILEPLWEGKSVSQVDSILNSRGIKYLAMDMEMSSINITGELKNSELENWKVFMADYLVPEISCGPYLLLRRADYESTPVVQ